MTSPDRTVNLTLQLHTTENGQHRCHLSPPFSPDSSDPIQCYGQTQDHAIANALEQLAAQYRDRTEQDQNFNWREAEAIAGYFHVILHYERIAENESLWDAAEHTIMGNTVIENARITVVGIDPDLPLDQWNRQQN